MFEKQKWSKELKAASKEFLKSEYKYDEELAKLIEMALEEGRMEVIEDPRKFDLLSEDDLPSGDREPSHNEGYD